MSVRLLKFEEADADEKEIQKAIEGNLECLDDSGLRYVKSFVPIGTGFIDTLAIDDQLNPVLIEYKKPGDFDRDALFQLMNYYSWFVADENHLKYLREVVSVSKPELVPKGEDLTNDIRLVAVVSKVSEDIRNACFALYPPVLLAEYRLLKQKDGTIGVSVISRFEPDREAKREVKAPKRLDDHFKRRNVRPLYDLIIRKVREVTNQEIYENPTVYYINIYTREGGNGFLGVYPAKNWIDLVARVKSPSPRFEVQANDTAWGPAGETTSVRIQKPDEVDDEVLAWAKKAYDRVVAG
jgi:hypothetical protein